MRHTRTVLTLLLAAATLLALALGGAAVATADEPANRGWSSPIDAVQKFGVQESGAQESGAQESGGR